MTFPENTFWCATPNLKCQSPRKLWSWSSDVTNLVREHCTIYRPEYIIRKSHVTDLMKS